jgi:hypothetical protein
VHFRHTKMIVLLVRVPFIICTAAALFYSRMLTTSLACLALLAWLGFHHPASNSAAQEFVAFLVSSIVGVAMAGVVFFSSVPRHRRAWASFFRDWDIFASVLPSAVTRPQQQLFSTDYSAMRLFARVMLGVLYTLLMYLCSEAMLYQSSNVHRWSTLASVVVVSFVAYVYDRHVSDAYSLQGVYRLVDSDEAHIHFVFAALSAVAILVDVMVHQTFAQNAWTAPIVAVNVLLQANRCRSPALSSHFSVKTR